MKWGLSRRTFKQLGQEYLNLVNQTNTCKNAFEKTSKADVETREKICQEYIRCFIKENLAAIDMLERASPKTAKTLRNSVLQWEKAKFLQLKELKKNYASNKELAFLPEDERDEYVHKIRNNVIDIIVNDGMALQKLAVNTAFNAAFEAIKKSGNKPPMQLDEYIGNLLLKHYPKVLKCYEGAWQAFESDNPDRFRHVSTSLRELIKNILGESKEERKKVLRTLSNSVSEDDFIESLVEVIYTNDRLLNKGVHSDIEEEIVTFSMRTCETILQYVLERQER